MKDPQNVSIPENVHKQLRELEAQLAAEKAKNKQLSSDLSGAEAKITELSNQVIRTISINEDKVTMAAGFADDLLANVQTWIEGTQLSDAERHRLQGSGVRRYGFLDKVSDMMSAKTDFIPEFATI